MPGRSIIHPIPWFERTFALDRPQGEFPAVAARLAGTAARLEEAVRGLTPVEAMAHEDGRWSIHENVGHLLDLEPLWAGRLEDLLSGVQQLRDADLTNRATHEANHDATPLAELLAGFRAARSAFVARLEDLNPMDVMRTALHPRLHQPMSTIGLCTFVAEHDDHHLARIFALRGGVTKSLTT